MKSIFCSGSAREHLNQMEIQLVHMRRMHQMQDDYVQCLSRNDDLLFSMDTVIQVILCVCDKTTFIYTCVNGRIPEMGIFQYV